MAYNKQNKPVDKLRESVSNDNKPKPNSKKVIKNINLNLKVKLVPEQKKIVESFYEKDYTFILGDASSGKTFTAVYSALNYLSKGECEQLWITRPMIKNQLSALPGAQPLTSKILTPYGWVTMGEIKEGDTIYAFDGSKVKVLGTFDHGKRDVYEITTSNGAKARVCDKHIWEVMEKPEKGKSVTKIMNTLDIKKGLKKNLQYILPNNKELEFVDRTDEIQLDVYESSREIGKAFSCLYQEEQSVLDFRTKIEKMGITENLISNTIKLSTKKHRLDAISGVLASTGMFKTNGVINAPILSEVLAQDLYDLTKSLGGFSKITKISEEGIDIYNVTIGLNSLMTPKEILTGGKKKFKEDYIIDIKKVSNEDVRCIKIDHERELYITDNYIVTHNTLEEKMMPYTFPIIQNIEECVGKELTQKMLESGVIKIMPVDVAKGVTFKDSVVIFDEGQDCDYEDFRTMITRLGKNSKMIICGSKQQIARQIKQNSSFYRIDCLKDSNLVGFHELKSNHRSESLTHILPILDKYHNKITPILDKGNKVENNKLLLG